MNKKKQKKALSKKDKALIKKALVKSAAKPEIYSGQLATDLIASFKKLNEI